MKREIKFRAWDKENNTMCTWRDIDNMDRDGICHLVDILNDPDKWGFVPMEYTGLKDRHGNEIWEGDVLRNRAFTYEIMFAEYGWYARSKEAGIPSEDLKKWFANESEIIGNIYSNPELLNK